MILDFLKAIATFFKAFTDQTKNEPVNGVTPANMDYALATTILITFIFMLQLLTFYKIFKPSSDKVKTAWSLKQLHMQHEQINYCK